MKHNAVTVTNALFSGKFKIFQIKEGMVGLHSVDEEVRKETHKWERLPYYGMQVSIPDCVPFDTSCLICKGETHEVTVKYDGTFLVCNKCHSRFAV